MVPAFAGTQTLGAPAKAGAMAVRKGRLQPAGFSRRCLSIAHVSGEGLEPPTSSV